MDAASQPSAPMDLSRFEGDFLQEAGEHLAQMENVLVRIDPAAPHPDEINAVFRAAHSIKGGSDMFGFTDTTAVTHELESLLDKVRKGELALTKEMIDVLLHGADVVRAQLAFHAHAGPAPDIAIDVVCGRIRACTGTAASPFDAPAVFTESTGADSATRTFEITYPAQAMDAVTTTELFDQLAELGALDGPDTVGAKADARTIRLTTDSGADVVLTLFDFVMDARSVCVRTIETRGTSSSGSVNPQAARSNEDDAVSDARGIPPQRPAVALRGTVPLPASATTLPASQESIRVSVEKVDQLVNQVGELVITRAMLEQCVEQLDPVHQARLLSRIADLQRNTRDLQESVMSIRMLPIASVFERFPRLARDLASKLGKEVQVRLEGEHTELDKGLIERIVDPLVHLVRNAIDHGIERTEERIAAGKSKAGTLTLTARHQGGNIVIEVCDDGRGLRRDRIMAKARERGMPVHDAMPDRELWSLLFEPGFSTAEIVTDVSGRGVGMDVVKRNITGLGGSIVLDSVPGSGTRVSIRVPLTLAIMDGLAVAVGDERYIVPLAGIVESLQVKPGQLRSIAGHGLVLDLRDEFLPVVFLSTFFGVPPRHNARLNHAAEMIVVVEAEGTKTALAVDELLGQNQVVVKSLHANFRRVPGLAGATIMGDGRVVCILDLAAIVRDRAPAGIVTLH